MKDDTTSEGTDRAAGAHGWVNHPLREFIDAAYMAASLANGVAHRRIVVQAAPLSSTCHADDPAMSRVFL